MNSNSACNTTLFKSWKKPLPSQWHVMVTCSSGHPQGQQWCGCESMWVTSELCAHILSPRTRWLCPAHTCGNPPPPAPGSSDPGRRFLLGMQSWAVCGHMGISLSPFCHGHGRLASPTFSLNANFSQAEDQRVIPSPVTCCAVRLGRTVFSYWGFPSRSPWPESCWVPSSLRPKQVGKCQNFFLQCGFSKELVSS